MEFESQEFCFGQDILSLRCLSDIQVEPLSGTFGYLSLEFSVIRVRDPVLSLSHITSTFKVKDLAILGKRIDEEKGAWDKGL